MASHLDLEEQEQLDQLKHFWKQYGNLITWVLVLVLGAGCIPHPAQGHRRTRAGHAAYHLRRLTNHGL